MSVEKMVTTRMVCGAVALAICTGCAAGGRIDSDMKRLQSSMGDLRSFQAEQTSQIAALQQQVRSLSGKVEELEFSQNKRLGSDLTSLKSDLLTLKRRVPPPANVPVQPLEEDEAMADTLPPPSNTDFTDALLKIRSGGYSDALPILQNLMQQAGSGTWAPNIIFWIGVCYDGVGEPKNALSSYNDLVTQFPRSRRAPLALVRQASVFGKIGDPGTAELTLKKLIAEYPSSAEAEQAKGRLGKKGK